MKTHSMFGSFTSVLMIAVSAHGLGLAAPASPTESTVPGIVTRVLSQNTAGTLWSYWPLPCVSLDGSVFVDRISTPKGPRWRVNEKMTDLSGIALGFVGEANEPVMVKALPAGVWGVAPIVCGQKRAVQMTHAAIAEPLIEVAGPVVTVRCDAPTSVLANDWAVVLRHRKRYYYNGNPLDCAGVSGASFALAAGAPGYACVAKGQERDTVYLNDQKLSSHFAVYGPRLSDNGKHVAYAADDGDSWGVFLDGKKLCDLDKTSVGGRVLAVSGDGQRALYTAQKSVYLNGKKVVEGDGLRGALGDDGKSWAVVTKSALILNGNVASKIPYSEARFTDTGKLIAWCLGGLFFEGRDYRIGRSFSTAHGPGIANTRWPCVDNTYWDGKRLRISWVEIVDNKIVSHAVDTSAMRPSADLKADLKKDNETAIVFDEEAGATPPGEARKDNGDDAASPKGDVLDKADDAANKVEDVKRRIDNIRDRLRF